MSRATIIPFGRHQSRALLALARRALGDAEVFDEAAGSLGLTDRELSELREELQAHLDGAAEETAPELERGTRLPGEVSYEGEDGDSADYEMHGRGMWVTVGGVSVHLYRPFSTDDLAVEVTPRGHEDCEQVAALYATETELNRPCDCGVER